MIEYKFNNLKNWIPIPGDTSIESMTFAGYSIRIGTQVFTCNTAEFREAWEADKIWSKLKQ